MQDECSILQEDLEHKLAGMDMEQRAVCIRRRISEDISRLSDYTLNPEIPPFSESQLPIADLLVEGRVLLNDGSSYIPDGPYPWFSAAKGPGMKGTRFITPRIPHTALLIRAYEATGDVKYLQSAHDYIIDFFSQYWREAELKDGDTWLDVGIRVGRLRRAGAGCGGIFPAFVETACLELFTYDELMLVLSAVDRMITALIPNLALGSNWRIHQLDGILCMGFGLPLMKDSSIWQKVAVNSLNEEFVIQIRDDGSHEEHCYHYGAGMWTSFAKYYELSKLAPDMGLSFDEAKIARSADTYIGACKPFGGEPIWGDCYGSRYERQFDPTGDPFRNSESHTWKQKQ